MFHSQGKVVFKVRKIINLIKQSNNINMHVIKRVKFFDLFNQSFIIDFEVRWNTTFHMLERFYEFKIVIDEITTNPVLIEGLNAAKRNQLKNLVLSADDWRAVEMLMKILKPFKLIFWKIFNLQQNKYRKK